MTSLATIPNPFRSSIVSDPWKSLEADVPTIHQHAFARCCEAIASVRATHQTTGVLVHGEAGSGKTHLLARLRAHIAMEAEADGPGGLEEAVFISVQLQTSAKMIWQHLRRRVASDFLRREDGAISQFERLMLHQLTKNNLILGDALAWLERMRRERTGADQLEEVIGDLFGLIDTKGQISYKLRRVLLFLFMKKHLGEANAWLRGESLPKAALQKLGVDVSSGVDEESGEAEAQDDEDSQIVIGLCSLATAEMPLIFCFDQLEALQTYVEDKSGLFAFGRMICDLHSFTQHLLIISCVQSAFLDSLSVAVRRADFERIKAFGELTLNPLTSEQAMQLVKARLDALPELKQLRADQTNPFWPLQESEISQGLAVTGYTARQLLTRCEDLYDVVRQGSYGRVASPPPVTPVDQFLDQELEARRLKAVEESAPSLTQNIVEHGLPALVYLAGKGWRQKDQALPSEVDLLFEGPQGRTAVSICNSVHWPSLVKKLDRLDSQLGTPQLDQLVLLRDSRLPIGPTAARTRALREQLLRKGARWVEPSSEALAALAALRRLLADAQSGDLANRGDTVELKTVQAWLSANLAVELRDLLEEILPTNLDTEPIVVNEWSLYEDIAALLQRHHVVSVTDIAARLDRGEKEITECAQQHVNQIGIIGEPPLVLFRLVGESLAG